MHSGGIGVGRRRHSHAWAMAVGMTLLAAAPFAAAQGGSATPPRAYGAAPAASVPLDHIVVVMQENHVYDNYFGTYCLVVGPYCSSNATGIPPGTCVPKDPTTPGAGCIAPYRLAMANVTTSTDYTHDWPAAHQAWDNGSLDGFYLAEGKHLGTFGYYDGSLLPSYWDLAEEYGLGDNFYASVLSYSTPNHWYLLAGTAPAQGYNQTLHKGANANTLTSNEEAYLNEANATPTIEDLLLNSSVSWKYYDYALTNYTRAIHGQAGAGTAGSAFDYWNPLAARSESYAANTSSHFVNSSSFFTDAAAGTLPNVSWVLPTFSNSDHPPTNLQNGENWVTRIVNSVEASPEWNRTAIFVSWDDYGGYYDHLPPPILDAYGVSFRVPLLVIGPYVRENFVDHHFEDFESILHLIEWRFGLPSLTARDASAPLPLEYFDFSAAPRAPMTFANASGAAYPLGLQSVGSAPTVSSLTAQAGASSVTLNWSLPTHGAAVSSFQLTYGPQASPSQVTGAVDASLTTLTIANLAAGTTYAFSLAARVGGTTGSAATVNATPQTGPPMNGTGSAPTWEKVAPAGGPGPSARSGASMAYDAADRMVVFFGGKNATGVLFNDTWAYTGNGWVPLAPAHAPPPRSQASLVYDSTDRAILLFGGHGAHGARGDTWRFVGGVWTNISSSLASSPAPRWAAAMAMDSKDGSVLLFGGTNGTGAMGDTWRFVHGAWTTVAGGSTVPPARAGAGLTYYAGGGFVLLFGGTRSNGSRLNDTWRYAAGSWHAIGAKGAPPPTSDPIVVYDPREGAVLVTGGATASGDLASTWSFAASKWHLLASPSAPPPRTQAAATYDPLAQGTLVAMGNGTTGPLADLWAYVPPLVVRISASPTYLGAGSVANFYPVVTGGLGPPSYLWTFDDGSQLAIVYAWHAMGSEDTSVTLRVTDGGGTAVAVSVPVEVD